MGMPYSTMDSIFKRGVANASVINIIKICETLGINTDDLAKGEIVHRPIDNKKTSIISDRGKYKDFIELIEQLNHEQQTELKGYMKRMICENETADAAKQISDVG